MNRFRMGHQEKGATLVETALVLPMLFMLTVGIWTTARAWNVHNVMDHAVREAARFGATDSPFVAGDVLAIAEGETAASAVNWADITTKCVSLVSGSSSAATVLDSTSASACISDDSKDPTTDKRTQVALQYPNYKLSFVFFSVTITLDAQAVSRREPGLSP